ncbi:MAG: CPXCG motif-containing cysteine-rich protein [Calditrichia bacterium]
MIEYFFICPYCLQRISMLLDLSVPEQSYIEDCEICCNPIKISYRVRDSEIAEFDARILE